MNGLQAGFSGLSPLARGTPCHSAAAGRRDRFIPAGAGNTECVPPGWPATAVYPRWRGEHMPASICCSLMSGLSPLARGTPACRGTAFPGTRFIPAGAGNTACGLGNSGPYTVYPRWRGEHIEYKLHVRFTDGLSPLARGTLRRKVRNQRRKRFIPAGAGNTLRLPRREPQRPVYPRWRGEHPRTLLYVDHARGLSPLARGTRSIERLRLAVQRFIPAGAGNTRCRETRSASSSVYPRWRGEHFKKHKLSTDRRGLSPLARGTH